MDNTNIDLSFCEFVVMVADSWHGVTPVKALEREKVICVGGHAGGISSTTHYKTMTPELAHLLESGLTGENFIIFKSMTIHETISILNQEHQSLGGCAMASDMLLDFRLLEVGDKRILVLNFHT